MWHTQKKPLSHSIGVSPLLLGLSCAFASPLYFYGFNSFTTKDELGKAAPQLLTPGLMGDPSESFSAPEDESPREYQANDSDSDGPILYTDDDDEEEDEDEDGSGESKAAFTGWGLGGGVGSDGSKCLAPGAKACCQLETWVSWSRMFGDRPF